MATLKEDSYTFTIPKAVYTWVLITLIGSVITVYIQFIKVQDNYVTRQEYNDLKLELREMKLLTSEQTRQILEKLKELKDDEKRNSVAADR